MFEFMYKILSAVVCLFVCTDFSELLFRFAQRQTFYRITWDMTNRKECHLLQIIFLVFSFFKLIKIVRE